MINTDKKLYFVDLDDCKNYLLALDVQFRQEDAKSIICFFDTNRGRMFYGDVLIGDENHFVFKTEESSIMTFRIATVKEFNSEWITYIEGTVPMFKSDSELHSWYYKQFLE